MRTATANPNTFEYVARPQLPVVAEALIPAGWLLTIGLLNLFYAISVLAGSRIFITTALDLVVALCLLALVRSIRSAPA